MENKLLSAALRYAERKGWRIHPCKPDKSPYIKAWQNNATSDPGKIREWWGRWPDALIGCACGPESGIWVLDADLPDGPAEVDGMNLPETLKQQTGSGGYQYIWQWNGCEIRNSSRKIAPGVDVRGNGGYIVLPPSPHPSGNKYKWANRAEIVHAPDWLTEKAVKQVPPEYKPHDLNGNTPYGQSALTQEIIFLSSSPQGTRNDSLNNCALKLGSLVAGGELDEGTVRNALMSCALTIGLRQDEAKKTIDSGFKKGFAAPRKRLTHETHGTHASHADSRKLTETHTDSRPTHGTHGRFQGNLTDHIRQYIKENQGSFTNSDIDREFGITHPKDKDLRRYALTRLKKDNYIKPDKRISGKYHILASETEWVDLAQVDSSYFDVALPLGLSDMVNTPTRCINVIAGTSNAGKTAFLLEVLRLNLAKKFKKIYFMSEMGPSEYRQRVSRITEDLDGWQKQIKAAAVSSGYDGPILMHNPDGLNVIDFLEEIEGEYYRITSDIRSIYDALFDGVVWLALQKHSLADVGRGGEGTMEKSRLYLTIDTLCHKPRCTISAVKIIKAKDYSGENPNGKEIHVKITGGSKIEAISKWMYCNKTQREQYKRQYEQELEQGAMPGRDFSFKTTDGATVIVKEADWQKWQENFDNIDVAWELKRISQDTAKKPFLKYKGYFFQLSGILKKINDERG